MPLGLVIEDDEDIARLFAVALREAQFTVEVVHNGRVGMERLEDIRPDLVLLDLNLPSMNGIEILQRVRRDDRLADTAVIVITANPQMADEIAFQADLVLLKPVSYVQLRDLVERFA